jgi:hypothetical protein
MRLNFSNAAPERIQEGIGRLAKAVKKQLAVCGDTIDSRSASTQEV